MCGMTKYHQQTHMLLPVPSHTVFARTICVKPIDTFDDGAVAAREVYCGNDQKCAVANPAA